MVYNIDELILRCMDEETGEIDEEMLIELQMKNDDKIRNLIEWVCELRGTVEYQKAEIARITELKRTTEDRIERLTKVIRHALDGEKWKDGTHSVSYRKSKAVTITDYNALPLEYLKVKTEPDKTAIKEAIKGGATVEGAMLVENTSVIIK